MSKNCNHKSFWEIYIIEELEKDLQEFKKENNLINQLFHNPEYGEITNYSVYNY